MASRPAKRQRRGLVVRSDSDDDGTPPVNVTLRTPKKQTHLELGGHNGSPLTFSPSQAKENPKRAASRKTSTVTSTTNSPKKPRKGTHNKDADRNTRLSSFFSKATEDQRWNRKVGTPELDSIVGDEDDAIVDDDLSDDTLLAIEAIKHDDTTKATLDRRKISRTDLESKKAAATADHSLPPPPPPASQRFMKLAVPTKRVGTVSDSVRPRQDEGHHRPWADRYGPASVEELAVHKKKLQDVQKWLDDALSDRHRQRLLLLKGPAGSGKTTTISLLASVLGFRPISWHNPVGHDAGGGGSVAAQFDDFLNRGGRFGSLSFEDDAHTLQSNLRPVLLVEEFPASAMSSGVEAFRSIIHHFLARPATTPAAPFRGHQSTVGPPLVMIVSETLLSSSTALSDSFTAHRLLGPEILTHSLVNVIEFNPVAPTIVAKALDLVMRKEARDSGRRRMPGPAVMQHLTEMGDVRNAVNTLEFLCVRNLDSDWSGTVAAKAKKGKAGTSMTDMEKNSLQLLSRRETTLDMFHAAGKIMYNKRDEAARSTDSRAHPPPKPPDHLMQHHRPKVSQVDIDILLNETGTDIQTFISTLHENYVLSCHGESFVDSFEACAESLSASDILNPDSRRQLGSRSGLNSSAAVQANTAPTSSDALRQDEISFHVATRGLLFHLPYPVHRARLANGGKSDAFKMFYPVGLRLWKGTEEMDSLIGVVAASAGLVPTPQAASVSASSGGVATWRTSAFGSVHSTDDAGHESADGHGRALPPQPSRDELVLDILPHLGLIRQQDDDDLLHRIVRFNGLAADDRQQDEAAESRPFR
ncbi:hypothetical protein DV737_g2790, partial [Chaetothyriales sp. CBS 132003]